MPKAKTICEVEFEKWWGDNGASIGPTVKAIVKTAWNQSWKTCGDKIMESVKKK